MTYISVKCPVCESEKVYKNGRTKSGKQQYMCNNKNYKKSSFIVDYTYNIELLNLPLLKKQTKTDKMLVYKILW